MTGPAPRLASADLFDLDAEREVLGDQIRDKQARRACAELDGDELVGAGHEKILDALRALTDPLTIEAVAAAAEVPLVHVAECFASSITPMTATWRVRRLRELASRRRQIALVRQHAIAAASESDARELLNRLRCQVDAELARLRKAA